MDSENTAIDKVRLETDPILREVSSPVTEFNEETTNIVHRMMNTMLAENGIGLSAVQIGITKRIIVAAALPYMYYMINPEFVRKLNREAVEIEGCLSIPGLRKRVSRPAKCEIKWQDLKGKEHCENFSGLLARIIQHEMDHLDGILITDKPNI